MSMAKPHLSLDGEAIDGLYALMRISDGRELRASEGRELRTAEIFRFLASKPQTRFHCFGMNYDANMWLRDLPEPHLRRLYETGAVVWQGWLIEWIPSKMVRVINRPSKIGFTVEECWGYFQQSFISALEKWDIDCPDVIEWGKRERVDFSYADMDRASEYCFAETVALQHLMDRVKACSAKVGLEPSSWIGPGVLASALLAKNNVQDHHLNDSQIDGWDAASPAVMSAYFGGRVECLAQGRWERAHAYDLSSAYPAALLTLPSLRGALIERQAEYEPDFPHSVWRCRWSISSSAMLTPFPVRVHKQIWYPAQGEGWYHACEVAAALALWPDDIEVLEGMTLFQDAVPSGFGWVKPVYNERRRLLENGDMAGQMLKLALNSCYGKMAQSRGRKGPKPKPPRWRNFWWAGYVTARTRAWVLELLALADKPPIAISTDGVIVEDQIPVATTKGELGGWEHSVYEDLALLGPGIYSYTLDGERYHKSRGFYGKEVDWVKLEEAILAGKNYSYESRRFLGLGVALQRKDLRGLWRTWETVPDRKINARIDRRDLIDGELHPISEFLVSQPFVPSDGSMDVELDEMMDQPDVC